MSASARPARPCSRPTPRDGFASGRIDFCLDLVVGEVVLAVGRRFGPYGLHDLPHTDRARRSQLLLHRPRVGANQQCEWLACARDGEVLARFQATPDLFGGRAQFVGGDVVNGLYGGTGSLA